MNSKKLNLRLYLSKLNNKLNQLRRYSLVMFVLFVGLLYGLVLWRINSLRDVTPSDTDVSSQVQAAHVPHIDESVVHQLESLKDNSVSVHALFDEARNNPFQ